MTTIYIIDDDEIMRDCLETAISAPTIRCFSNAIDAINAIDDDPPALIFLDVLLDGPDGFTFLNEIASYSDLNRIPIVLVTNLEIKSDLHDYGVVGILNKSTMTPQEIKTYVRRYA